MSQPDRQHQETVVDTRYWHARPDGRVQCDVCPRACRMHEGQRGLCFVRGVEDGRVKLFTYGRSSGFCVDPIEKKPLNHFLPGSAVLSFGTAGCNLACKFCQNWDMSKSREMDTLADSASPSVLAAAAEQLGCASIAYTYNDPAVFMEYAIDVAKAARTRGVRNVAVTAGYMCPEPRAELFEHMDAANIDLKGFTPDFYRKVCGAELAHVLETLEYVRHETRVWLEVTTLLIPGLNDSDSELEAMCAWFCGHLGPDVPLHFTAFHPDWKMRDVPATPLATLRRARQIALRHGLRYVYTGNVRDAEGGSTWCHACGAPLIGRDGYAIGQWALSGEGRCSRCGTACAGVFTSRPGDWGPHRAPVRLSA
ncbi:MAG: AmmeMemoRadiSam system radical SAM enzyme [Steroidobacteraceae bacterium]